MRVKITLWCESTDTNTHSDWRNAGRFHDRCRKGIDGVTVVLSATGPWDTQEDTPVGRDNDSVVTPPVFDRVAELVRRIAFYGVDSTKAEELGRKVAQTLAEEGLLIMDPLPDEDAEPKPTTKVKSLQQLHDEDSPDYTVGQFLDGLAAGGMEFAEDEDDRRRDFQIARRLPQDVAEEIVDEYVDEDMHRGER